MMFAGKHEDMYYRDNIQPLEDIPPHSQFHKPLRYRIEERVCSNFTCCGLVLADLHELLQHYEDVHIRVNETVNSSIIFDDDSISLPPNDAICASETIFQDDDVSGANSYELYIHNGSEIGMAGLSLTDDNMESFPCYFPRRKTLITTPFKPENQSIPYYSDRSRDITPNPSVDSDVLRLIDPIDAPLSSMYYRSPSVNIPSTTAYKRARHSITLNGEFEMARSPSAPPFSTSYDDNELGSLHEYPHSPKDPHRPLSTAAILSPMALRQHHPERLLLLQQQQQQQEMQQKIQLQIQQQQLQLQHNISAQRRAKKFTSLEDAPLERPLTPQDERPYVCQYPGCGKSYKNANGLKYHAIHGHLNGTVPPPSPIIKTHEKPYKCPHPDCGKRYKNANGLKYHLIHGHEQSQENNRNAT